MNMPTCLINIHFTCLDEHFWAKAQFYLKCLDEHFYAKAQLSLECLDEHV